MIPRSIPIPVTEEPTDSIDVRQLQNADVDEFTPDELEGEGSSRLAGWRSSRPTELRRDARPEAGTDHVIIYVEPDTSRTHHGVL